MRRPGSGELPTSPPIRFPLYGLAESWAGARWLESYGDALGDEVRYAMLAHLSPDTDELTMVESVSRPLTDRGSEPPLQAVSCGATVTLVNLTLPDLSVPRLDGLNQALARHAVEQSERYAEWTPVTWQVDGFAVRARAWEFAGGWAAFSDALDDIYLAVASSAGHPDGLALARLRDAGAYHFDIDQPLHPRLRAETAALACGDREWRRRADYHPDQLRLVSGMS